MGDNISIVGDHLSTVEYSVLWRDTFSTVGGLTAVYVGNSFGSVGDTFSTVGDNISTVGDSFSTVEGIRYIGGRTQYMQGDNISTVGITSVLWRVFSTVGIPSVQWGITSVQWGITSVLWKLLSTVEIKI